LQERITGLSFLDLNEEKFCNVGFALESAILLTKEVQILKEKLKHAFFSYCSLSEVLAKYNINNNSIINIPQFKSDKMFSI